MRPKPADNQNLLFSAHLEQMLDHNHTLLKLANAIDRFEFEQAFGNPFDGHTLESSIEQAERLGLFKAEKIYVDHGYRRHDYKGSAVVHIVKLGWRKLPRSLRRRLKRRSVVEAVIGHSKNECRLGRNYLLGTEGDMINDLLCGCGNNIRRLLRYYIFWLYKILFVGRSIDLPA